MRIALSISNAVRWIFAHLRRLSCVWCPQFPMALLDAIQDSSQIPVAVLHQFTVYDRTPRRACK